MIDRGVPFPPLGNARVATVAVADVLADPVFGRLRELCADREPGSLSGWDERFDEWLNAMVGAANDQSHHFDLDHLHGSDGPRLVDLSGDGADQPLGRLHLGQDRGTTKLVVAVVLGGSGSWPLTIAGSQERATVGPGSAVVWPAFLAVSLDLTGAGPVPAVVTTVHGRAFR